MSISTENIPVIISHFTGKPNYLKYALESAQKFNQTVLLIGDQTNQNFWHNHWDATDIKSPKYQEFLKYYEKMSSYGVDYETGFWKRMFMLEYWMKENDVKKVFLLDSDILTFANYAKELSDFFFNNNYVAGFMTYAPEKQKINYYWDSSCHFSYWTIEGIEKFTDFCVEAYRNQNVKNKLESKYKWHLQNNRPGGVCEMTLLFLWSQENDNIINFTKEANNIVLDHNINMSGNYFDDEYDTYLGMKKFAFINDLPYCYNKVLMKQVRFLSIHCQGGAKVVMRFLVKSHFLRNFYFYPIVNITFKVVQKLKRMLKSILSFSKNA